jgi:hypothetical protein
LYVGRFGYAARMDLNKLAQEMRQDAERLIAAADALDGKLEKPRPKRKYTKRGSKAQKGASVSASNGKSRTAVTLPMGTAGHTTALDKDAEELKESLVHAEH